MATINASVGNFFAITDLASRGIGNGKTISHPTVPTFLSDSIKSTGVNYASLFSQSMIGSKSLGSMVSDYDSAKTSFQSEFKQAMGVAKKTGEALKNVNYQGASAHGLSSANSFAKSLQQMNSVAGPQHGSGLAFYRKDAENDKTATAANASAASAGQTGMTSYGMYSAMGSTATDAAATGTTTAAAQEDEDGIVIVTMAPDISMLVNIDVDEADILSLEIGQPAEVTIESVGENHFDGTVTDVDRTANSSGGVTTYSAEVTFAKEKGMLSGMSADVIVNIQGSENVLIVPADAIHRTSAGAFVYTSYDEETKTFGGNMPVEVGISNDDFAEIRSGIEEGTTVFYTEKEEDNFYMMMGGPGMNGRSGNNRR